MKYNLSEQVNLLLEHIDAADAVCVELQLECPLRQAMTVHITMINTLKNI